MCQCDNFSCERHNGLICSGPEHGTCVCGVCECKEGWMGDNCACKNATNLCIKPDSEDPTQICSGNGDCECGICKCRETEEGKYFGRFCEHCPFKVSHVMYKVFFLTQNRSTRVEHYERRCCG